MIYIYIGYSIYNIRIVKHIYMYIANKHVYNVYIYIQSIYIYIHTISLAPKDILGPKKHVACK